MSRKKRSPIWKIPSSNMAELVAKSSTYSNILSFFGLNNIGGNIRTLKDRLDHDEIDHSHIVQGRASNKNRKFPGHAVPLDEVMVENSTYSRHALRKRLIKDGIIPYECQTCGLGPVWLDNQLALSLDHINGIRNDNRRENLRFLCPNCHTQTETFAGKNTNRKPRNKCIDCNVEILKISERCSKCEKLQRRKVERPTKEELEKMLWQIPTMVIAETYDVSDSAVAKWAKSYGIEKPTRGYWTKLKSQAS
jgi:hypothetical protein